MMTHFSLPLEWQVLVHKLVAAGSEPVTSQLFGTQSNYKVKTRVESVSLSIDMKQVFRNVREELN